MAFNYLINSEWDVAGYHVVDYKKSVHYKTNIFGKVMVGFFVIFELEIDIKGKLDYMS